MTFKLLTFFPGHTLVREATPVCINAAKQKKVSFSFPSTTRTSSTPPAPLQRRPRPAPALPTAPSFSSSSSPFSCAAFPVVVFPHHHQHFAAHILPTALPLSDYFANTSSPPPRLTRHHLSLITTNYFAVHILHRLPPTDYDLDHHPSAPDISSFFPIDIPSSIDIFQFFQFL